MKIIDKINVMDNESIQTLTFVKDDDSYIYLYVNGKKSNIRINNFVNSKWCILHDGNKIVKSKLRDFIEVSAFIMGLVRYNRFNSVVKY